MDKKAFTLLELLVVIAILGIILAMLFPALGRVREGGRRIQCTNNLRQHGIAWYLYLDDHEEKFPKEAAGNPTTDVQCGFYTFGGWEGNHYVTNEPGDHIAGNRPLNRYLDVVDKSSADIFRCLNDIKPNGIAPEPIFDYYGTSYQSNARVLAFGSPTFTQRPLRTITSPRNKVWLEMCTPGMVPGHSEKGPLYDGKIPVMVLFVDGHVQGPYKYNDEFDITALGTQPEKPVRSKPD